MQKQPSGFTLIEVVVVVANIMLLAAIIVPLVGRVIDHAKIARAQNECHVIAAAIKSFYSDVGIFPASSVGGAAPGRRYDKYLTRLVSGTSFIYSNGGGLSYGYTANTNDDWYDDGGGALASSPETKDVLDNHLNQNSPTSAVSFLYPTTGEARWRGPYMAPIRKDPWGHYYVCNIDASYTGSNALCVVISAGPNGYFDTAPDPAATVTAPTEDDIWSVVTIRRQ